MHHANVVDSSHRNPVLSAVYLTKKFIIPGYARKFTVLEHEAMRSGSRDVRLWFGHIRNVALGAPQLTGLGFNWVLRHCLTYRRVPYVVQPNATGTYPLSGEQAPNPDSRVLLANGKDRSGVPSLKVDWRASELDSRTLSSMPLEFKRSMEGCGCGTIDYDENQLDEDVRTSAVPVVRQHIGSARTSESPRAGVVNADCRAHYVDNIMSQVARHFPL